MNDENMNTTDATVGQILRVRVAARRAELAASLARPNLDSLTRQEVQQALSTVAGLLTGDLDRIPKVVAVELNTWLEANKHVDERHPSAIGPE
jgi:hypothetical protein